VSMIVYALSKIYFCGSFYMCTLENLSFEILCLFFVSYLIA